MFNKPALKDFLFLSLFVILITLHPYFLHGEINQFELGIYLPGISAVLDGQIPYRDFFHLRGPFELYIPAGLMRVLGEKISVMEGFFYFGTVVTLILCVLAAKEIYRTRFVLYLMAPVLIGRTFPRVVFTFWGGMRFALGILAVYFAVKHFKDGQKRWLFAAGIASGCAALTSVEIGVCAVVGIISGISLSLLLKIKNGKEIRSLFLNYLSGIAIVVGPFLLYLQWNHAFLPYIEATWSVVSHMQHVFNINMVSNTPASLGDAVLSMINPTSENFKYMTPAYLYVFTGGYFIYRIRQGRFDYEKLGILALAVYGFMMYVSAFRNIEAAQLEMALQPEKILLFFLMEEIYLYFKAFNRVLGIGLISFVLMASSIGYSVERFNRRFWSFKYVHYKFSGRNTRELQPLHGQPLAELEMARVGRMVVPKWQAEDFKMVAQFIQEETSPGDPVLMFHELAIYHFIVDRPFVGRFPMGIFAWLNDRWHKEFIVDLQRTKPKIAVVAKAPPSWFEDIYFKVPGNRLKYDDVLDYIHAHYTAVQETPSLIIYKRK
ncbi:MAG TPA: hypothetical protein DD723_04420 [Candidatus Omnitrophica bacterium]|nr:MAG: hypothetical protein A2Z81_03920 [Omnitrophica WOR_2 bacterium GWA2_45_18]HBR14774.1 hypothetical protein [Candidatus Omnitrophota bacterium]